MTRVAPAGRRPINTAAAAAAGGWSWAWVTHVAFVLVVAVMVARLTTPDGVREPWSPTPGGDPAGHGPGATTGLLFDLLAAVPALLVLARRAVDRDYRLSVRPSHGLLLAVVVWMGLSVAWSADRFLAVVSAAQFAGAACLLWAASQLVRSWDRLRVVAAVALGVLLAVAASTALYRFNDLAESRQYWTDNRPAILKQHGWTADSFEAVQMGIKLTTGEQTGSYNSANTLAAAGVLLLFAAGGLGVQRAADDRDPRWLGLTAAAVAAAGWVLFVARSKTSLATPVVGVGVLAAWWRFGPDLRRRPGLTYAAAVGGLVVCGLVVVVAAAAGGGLFPGHFSNSLDFRWKYWTAAAGVWRDHPLVGVGWANFGQSYLAHRRPEAAEEIRDPHDFLVRFAAELGTVGLALAGGWLLRLAWEVTRPPPPVDAAADVTGGDRPLRVGVVGWIAAAGLGLGAAATVDLSASAVDVLIFLMRPLLLLLAVVLGGIAGGMRSPHERAVDGRPGAWVFATVVVGLGLFLLHNLIDFSLFEAGPMCAFMTLAGAALGVAPAVPSRLPAGRPWAAGGLVIAAAAWVAVAAGVAVPVGVSTVLAGAADDAIRSAPAGDSPATAAAYRRAADGYAAAAAWVPYDGDLLARAARAAAFGRDGPLAHRLAAAAVAADPRLVDAYLLQADLAAGDAPAARAAFDAAVRLAPTDVSIRLRYAAALDHLGDRPAAAAQYRAALSADAALPAGEPRRLPPERVAELRPLAGL